MAATDNYCAYAASIDVLSSKLLYHMTLTVSLIITMLKELPKIAMFLNVY
jgi:hypothetical protein